MSDTKPYDKRSVVNLQAFMTLGDTSWIRVVGEEVQVLRRVWKKDIGGGISRLQIMISTITPPKQFVESMRTLNRYI